MNKHFEDVTSPQRKMATTIWKRNPEKRLWTAGFKYTAGVLDEDGGSSTSQSCVYRQLVDYAPLRAARHVFITLRNFI